MSKAAQETITRRAILRGTPAAIAAADDTDPIFAAIEEYRKARKAFDTLRAPAEAHQCRSSH